MEPRIADAFWWQQSIIHQIYSQSFQKSNGNGVGDLIGIRHRLDYLCALGGDAVWISLIYPPPMADFGYDVMGYRSIDPIFKTLADLDLLMHEAHDRGLKLV